MLSVLLSLVDANAAKPVYVDVHIVRLDDEALNMASLPAGHEQGWRDVELSPRQLHRLEKRGQVVLRQVLVAEPGDESIMVRDIAIPYISSSNDGTVYRTVPNRLSLHASPTSETDVQLGIEVEQPDFSRLVQGAPVVEIFHVELDVALADAWQVRSFGRDDSHYVLLLGPQLDGILAPHHDKRRVAHHRS